MNKQKGVEAKKDEFLGVILALLTAVVSGVSVVINKFFIVNIDPLIFTSLRCFFIGILFFIISLFVCKFNIKKFKKTSWINLVIIGIIGGGIAFLLFFLGLRETTAGRAAFLHKTLPLYAVILAFFFLKEKITKNHIIAMLSMLLGVLLIESPSVSFGMRIGDLLVISAAFLWAVENTIAKRVMTKQESNWVVTFSRMFFGSLLLFSIILLSGKTNLLFSLTTQQVIYIVISTFLLALYVLFWYWGLKHINLSKASIILLIAPLISLILGYTWLKEHIFRLQTVGSLLILAGAYIILKTKSEKRIEET